MAIQKKIGFKFGILTLFIFVVIAFLIGIGVGLSPYYTSSVTGFSLRGDDISVFFGDRATDDLWDNDRWKTSTDKPEVVKCYLDYLVTFRDVQNYKYNFVSCKLDSNKFCLSTNN